MKTNQLTAKSLVKLVFGCLLISGLAGCAYETTPNPQKLSRNVQLIPPTAVLSVFSMNDYKLSETGQAIEQSGLYKTIYGIYDETDGNLLIPSNALIRGTYNNNGVTCTINWTSVYAYNEEDNRNAVALDQVTRPTICDPQKGIKAGEHLIIRFTDSKM